MQWQRMGITQKINQVPMQIAMGLSQGIMPLISYNYSSGNHKRMRGTLSFTVKISQGFLCAVAVLYFVFAGPLTRMFMDNEVIVGYGIRFLRGFCLGMPFCVWISWQWVYFRQLEWEDMPLCLPL